MDSHLNKDYEQQGASISEKELEKIDRRDFTKKAIAGGLLSSLGLFLIPDAAEAWLDGKIKERDDLGDAFRVLIKTYSDTTPYPHKFNDALVKLILRDLDFVVRKGVEKQFVEDYVQRLGVLVNKHLQKGIDKFGKDVFLWAMFERTSCSYQLYEHIDIKAGQRSFPCPFKPMLDRVNSSLGTYTITWDDIHDKWCTSIWNNFITGAGLKNIKIKVEPGEICTVKVL